MKPLHAIARQLRKTHGGLQFKFSVVGSFIALRIEDPQATVTFAQAQALFDDAGVALRDQKILNNWRAIAMRHIEGGVVANWSIHD